MPPDNKDLIERLRARVMRARRGSGALTHRAPDKPCHEAADTIARLEAEVEDAKAGRDQYADLYGRRCGDLLKAQCELASTQALIGELVEGLEPFAAHAVLLFDSVPDSFVVRGSWYWGEPVRDARGTYQAGDLRRARTLILKARTLSGGSGG